MADIAWSDVLALPGASVEMAGVSAGAQTMFLGVVNTQLDVTMFDGESGAITKLARCALAAHYGALSLLGSGGSIVGESEGGLSRQYAMPSAYLGPLYATSYGRLYSALISSKAHGPRLLR